MYLTFIIDYTKKKIIIYEISTQDYNCLYWEIMSRPDLLSRSGLDIISQYRQL